MQTTELSLRAQTILAVLLEVMTDLALELAKTHEDACVKVVIDAN